MIFRRNDGEQTHYHKSRDIMHKPAAYEQQRCSRKREAEEIQSALAHYRSKECSDHHSRERCKIADNKLE